VGVVEKNQIELQIESAGAHMGRARDHLASGRPAEALASVEQARKALTGPLGRSLERLDGASVVAMLGKPRARVYADIAKLEGEAHAAAGSDASASRAHARAAEIEQSAR